MTDFNEEFASIIEAPLKDLEVNDIDIYLDRASIEVFVNDGALVMTALVFPTAAYTDLQLKGFETKNKLYSLKEIW